MDINERMANAIVKNGSWISGSADSIWMEQWASAASASFNADEQAEYEKISQSVQYSFKQSGSSVVLEQSQRDQSPFQQIVENGMEAPLSGGHGGYITMPDGSVQRSNVNPNLWGAELPWYAKEPNPISDGIETILNSKVPEWVQDVSTNGAVADAVGEMLTERLSSAIGGS